MQRLTLGFFLSSHFEYVKTKAAAAVVVMAATAAVF